MLVFNQRLIGLSVISVQASAPIGKTVGYLIDPRNLKLVAFYVQTRLNKTPFVLHVEDIREIARLNLIIDHNEQLMDTDGLIRLKEVIDIDFKLSNKLVVTEDKSKLGKVSTFVVDNKSWFVIKIHVQQPLLKNVGNSELIISRAQIVRVTDTEIVVKSTSIKVQSSKSSFKKMLFPSPKTAMNPDVSSLSEE